MVTRQWLSKYYCLAFLIDNGPTQNMDLLKIFILTNRRNMIFFSSQQRRNCLSAHNYRQQNQSKAQFTQPQDPKNPKRKIHYKDKQNTPQPHQSYHSAQQSLDLYKEQMKFLIDKNSDYFQNKVKITDKFRPNQYQFKIPTRTPTSIYKKNYPLKEKDLSVDNLKLNRNNLSQTIKIKDSEENLMFKSTYQNEFTFNKQNFKNRRKSLSRSRKMKEGQLRQEEDLPRFMQTHNKCFYLNWGGHNSVTSLKPTYQTVATNFPFNSKTIYKNDFQGKTVAPSKLVVPQSSITKLSNSFMISKSSYASDFSKQQKRGNVQKSCKPKHVPVKITEGFKGASEYRSEFVTIKELSGGFCHTISKEDLHAMILDL